LKITTLKAASLIAVPFTLGLASNAQAAPGVPCPISAQIGAGFLTSSAAKDATSTTGIHGGLSVAMQNKGLLGPMSKPSIDLDYNSNTGHGNHINVFGLGYSERVMLTPAAAAISATGHHAVPYVGLGIGAFRNDVRSSHTTTTTTPGGSNGGPVTTTTTTSSSKTDWRFGGKLIAGVDFDKTFIEASYDISGSTNGVRTDAVNLALGMHF